MPRCKYMKNQNNPDEESTYLFHFDGEKLYRWATIWKHMNLRGKKMKLLPPKGTNFFMYWKHSITFPLWKMVPVDAFVIWHSLNELISTSLYFIADFLQTNLFLFSILWAYGYEMTKPLILSNIEVPCYNVTLTIIYKGIIVFFTATFNWISGFKELINI